MRYYISMSIGKMNLFFFLQSMYQGNLTCPLLKSEIFLHKTMHIKVPDSLSGVLELYS